MALTDAQIRAMDKRELEVALAIQLFCFQWWAIRGKESEGKYLLRAGNAAVYKHHKHHDKGEYIWDAETLASIPLAASWDSEVSRYTQWNGFSGYLAVIFDMELLGWHYCTDVRPSIGEIGKLGSMERYAGFHRTKRNQEGAIERTWMRVMAAADLMDLPVAVCRAALWTLQPWENESWGDS